MFIYWSVVFQYSQFTNRVFPPTEDRTITGNQSGHDIIIINIEEEENCLKSVTRSISLRFFYLMWYTIQDTYTALSTHAITQKSAVLSLILDLDGSERIGALHVTLCGRWPSLPAVHVAQSAHCAWWRLGPEMKHSKLFHAMSKSHQCIACLWPPSKLKSLFFLICRQLWGVCEVTDWRKPWCQCLSWSLGFKDTHH